MSFIFGINLFLFLHCFMFLIIFAQQNISFLKMKNAIKVVRNEADKSITLTGQNARFSLIWLHGLGDTSEGFLDFFNLPQSPVHIGARVKLLHAPIRPVTLNGGMKMPSWYDIRISLNSDHTSQLQEDKKYSKAELQESLNIIQKNIKSQLQYWQKETKQPNAYNRIYIGGFSQGCATSLTYALTSKNIIAGIIGLSGHYFQSMEPVNITKLPVLLYHGKFDGMIPIHIAKKSYEKILNKENVKFQEKVLEHQVSIQELIGITNWLKEKASNIQ